MQEQKTLKKTAQSVNHEVSSNHSAQPVAEQTLLLSVAQIVGQFVGSVVELQGGSVPALLADAAADCQGMFNVYAAETTIDVPMVDLSYRVMREAMHDFLTADTLWVEQLRSPKGDHISVDELLQTIMYGLYGSKHVWEHRSVSMNTLDYVQSCKDTESSDLYIPDLELFANTLRAMASVGNDVDACKKYMFYGKPMPLTKGAYTDDMASKANMRQSIIDSRRLIHGILGMTTESVELIEQLYLHIVKGEKLDTRNVYEEVGDCLYYVSLVLDVLGVTYEEAMHDNHAKRMKRYQSGKFSKKEAIERDTEAELQDMTASGNLVEE